MPVVPRPQTMSVMPSVSSGGGFGNALSMDAATLPGRQISALGEAIQSGAHAVEVFARSETDKAEATVALDGSNRLQQKRFDLADPDKVFPGVNDWSKTEQALAEFDKLAITAAQVDGRMLTPQQRRDIALGQGHNVLEGHPFFDVLRTTPAMLAVTPEAIRTPRPASSANAGRGSMSLKPWESPDGFQTAPGFAGVRLAPESVYPPLSPPAWTLLAKEVQPASRLHYDPNWMTKALGAPPVRTSEDDRNRPSPAYSLKDGPPPKPVVDDKGFTLFSTQTIGPSEGFRPGVTVDSGQDVIRLTISNGKRGWVSGKTMDARKSVYDPSEPGSFGNPVKLRDAGVGTAAGYFAAGMQDTFGSRIMYQVKRIQENADGTLRWRFFPDKRDIVQQGDLQADFGGRPRTIEIPLTRPKPGEHFHYAVMLSGYDETAPGTSVQVWTKTNREPGKKP